MTLGRWYFAWVSDTLRPADFDPLAHARQDEVVISGNIEQAEGEFARASLRVRNTGEGLLAAGRDRYAFISVERDGTPALVFWGRVTGAPRDIERRIASLQLIAQPPAWESDQRTYVDSLKVLPFFDPALVPIERQNDPAEVLAGRSALLHWDRVTGAVSHSDILEGSRGTIDIANNYDADTLRVSTKAPPPARVDISLEVQWEQRGRGVLDIGSRIAQKFDRFRVNTLTPTHLEENWPKPGESFGDSGYTVLRSTIVRKTDPGYWSQYPQRSRRVTVKTEQYPTADPISDGVSQESQPERLMDFPRAWYDVDLIVRAEYAQKRRETAVASVEADVQPLYADGGPTQELNIRLQDVTADVESAAWQEFTDYTTGDQVLYGGRRYQATQDHTSSDNFYDDAADTQIVSGQEVQTTALWTDVGSPAAPMSDDKPSYFQTDRGQKSIEHAMLRAAALVRKGSRAVRIAVVAPAESALDVSCDHNLRISDDRLPGGTAEGKVTRYRISIAEDTGQVQAELTMECAIGGGGTNTGTGGAAAIGDYTDQLPYEPIDASDMDWAELNRTNEPIKLVNPGETQNELLPDYTPKQWLKDNPTSVDVKLRSLRAEGEISHRIVVPVSEPQSAPRQIDLET